MKTYSGEIVYQGDLAIRRTDKLPKQRTNKMAEDNRWIVAHSETGHHHYVEASQARFYGSADPLVCYLVIEGKYADLIHDRPGTAHETWRLPTGTYEIRRQREWTPEGWQRVSD